MKPPNLDVRKNSEGDYCIVIPTIGYLPKEGTHYLYSDSYINLIISREGSLIQLVLSYISDKKLLEYSIFSECHFYECMTWEDMLISFSFKNVPSVLANYLDMLMLLEI